MFRTKLVPLSNVQMRPSFWDFDRDLQEIIETVENTDRKRVEELNNFKETEEAFFMSFDIPGIKKENLEVEIEGNYLHISGKRKTLLSNNEAEEFKEIKRSIVIPKDANKEKVQVHYEDGVLYLALPRIEKEKPRKIQIKEGLTNSSWVNLLGESKKK